MIKIVERLAIRLGPLPSLSFNLSFKDMITNSGVILAEIRYRCSPFSGKLKKRDAESDNGDDSELFRRRWLGVLGERRVGFQFERDASSSN